MRICVLLSVVAAFIVGPAVADEVSYVLTNPAPTLKVQPTAADAGPVARELRIAMARGEYEPVQLVVSAPSTDLKKVRVGVGSLKGPDGASIAWQRVVVTPLGFVDCKKQSPGGVLKGEIPDVLLPNRSMDVPKGRRQPFYVTVQTTAKDLPGEYRGFVKVSVDGKQATLLPLTVRVYSLTIPAKSHLKTAFVIRDHFKKFTNRPDDHDAFIGALINYSKVMLSYRVSPTPLWKLPQKADGTYDFTDWDRLLQALAPLGLTTFDIGSVGDVAAKGDADLLKAAADHLKEKGWWDLHYVYGWDEASGDVVQKLPVMYKKLLEAVPDAKIVQTGWSPNPPIKDQVDIWCPLTAWIDFNACRAAQKEGKEIWWYVCCQPPAPHANVFVDSPGIDQRILGWMTFKEGITGFLYWGMDCWGDNTPPLDKYDQANYSNWNPLSFGDTFNGDGSFLYPGRGDSPLASVRLALLRDGFEDYDLFTEARSLADKGGPAAEKIKSLLYFDQPIIKSMTEFTQDGNELLKRREAVLRAAEGFQK